MQLLPWRHHCSAGFTLRGWHTPPSGKPLLHFLHGNGFCTRSYEPMLARLANSFDLWLCDLQGHGESDHGGPFVGWNRNAELAVEAFEAGRQRFADVPRFACGHSFGGVLTSLSLLGVRRNPMAESAKARRNHWPDRETAFGALHNRGIFRGWEPQAFQAHIDHALKDHHEHGVELKCRPSREAEVFASMPKRLWPALKRIQVPTLLAHGERTYPFVVQSAARLQKINRQVQVRSLPGGHCFMLEHSQQVAAEICAFLLQRD